MHARAARNTLFPAGKKVNYLIISNFGKPEPGSHEQPPDPIESISRDRAGEPQPLLTTALSKAGKEWRVYPDGPTENHNLS